MLAVKIIFSKMTSKRAMDKNLGHVSVLSFYATINPRLSNRSGVIFV